MPGSEIMLASSTLLLRSDTVIDASGMRLAVTTVSVSLSDACAWTERGDALRRATGLPYNSPLATTQSSAFFSTPGTPCAYSGLEIKTRSEERRVGKECRSRWWQYQYKKKEYTNKNTHESNVEV